RRTGMWQIVHWLRKLTSCPGRRGPATPRRRPAVERLEGREVPAGGIANYAVTQDWGTGSQASLSLVNSQPAAVASWRLEFDLAANITSVWDAQVVSHTGNHYVLAGATWDSDLPGGRAVSLGFVASPGHVASPSNYVLNGVPLGGTTPPPPP